ncbi:hypothetical protein HYALB_00002298 [Hymenoscyphus albidus]|uniref:Uncharacterized protein n=1 Tax=Hymenoscyphus albidus TaxID=595503 RepID=A0A9N9LZ63_9HELO|nr:hypothetical protein HYALB_00002298 [Hymenoscyphus albidus]
MRLTSIFMLAFASSVLAQAGQKVNDERTKSPVFCNNGTAGDGACEQNGMITYYCLKAQIPGFTELRALYATGRNPEGDDRYGIRLPSSCWNADELLGNMTLPKRTNLEQEKEGVATRGRILGIRIALEKEESNWDRLLSY